MGKLTFRYYPQPASPETEKLEKKIFKLSLIIPSFFILTMWLIKFIEVSLDVQFIELGVFPRHINGLTGIITSPLIHSNFSHLIGNSTSFLVLATALFFFYRKMALKIFILNYFLCGLLLWLGGREAWHIGASGVIYGLTAFLLFSGIFRQDLRLLTISLIVTFLYGSFIWGIFPFDPQISWDGHLMGAITGTILALLFYKYGPPRQKFEWEDEPDDDEQSDNKSDKEYIIDESTEDKINKMLT